jgi:hypothetical protein
MPAHEPVEAEILQATFQDRDAARLAVQDLIEAEFAPGQVRLAVPQGRRRGSRRLVHWIGDQGGALLGTALGAVAGFGLAAFVLSGTFSPAWLVAFLGHAPGWALLRGTLAGALVGGLAGAVGGLAWWSVEAPLEELEPGPVVVSVTDLRSRTPEARRILGRRGAVLRAVARTAPEPPARPLPGS